ncbi:MAG: SPOR domain-containing protein [Candidatus Omnitrophota bacterium]|jgi:tetratricopeptide (TPR) repeat protein|nr:MAG: SPOR domain-containing protein [Candidatus Omnitrophota bacterium]
MRITIILFLVLAFVSTGVYGLNLDNIKIKYLQGDYKAAIKEGEKLVSSSDHSSYGIDELYYLLGLSYLQDGNYLRASDIFEIIINELKPAKYKDKAKLGLGDVYLLRGDYNKADLIYKELLGNEELRARIYYRLSETGFKLGNAAQGKEYSEKLKTEFPLSLEEKNDRDFCLIDKKDVTYYSVQVGAFSSQDNAKNLVQELLKKGYSAYIEEATLDSSSSYRVRVGKLSEKQDAESLGKQLSAEGYPTKICP